MSIAKTLLATFAGGASSCEGRVAVGSKLGVSGRQCPALRQIKVVPQLRKWVLGTKLIVDTDIHGARTAVAGRKLKVKFVLINTVDDGVLCPLLSTGSCVPSGFNRNKVGKAQYYV